MFLTDFKIQFLIPLIHERLLSENKLHLKSRLKCGSLSALTILEYFGIDYDIEKFINDSNDGDAIVTGKPQDGSTILDIVFALANSGFVDIEFYMADDKEPAKTEAEKIQLQKENNLRKKISELGIVARPPITIDEILFITTNNSIPILGFHRNGDLSDAHFSPLRGDNGLILMFTLDSKATGDCNVYKEDFVKTWWTLERELLGAIIVKKK